MDRAAALLEDSLHLHQLYHPDSPGHALTTISNLATLRRSRLTGDPLVNTCAAVELFERALAIDGQRSQLSQTDRITLRTNHLNALAGLMTLEPGAASLARLLAAIDDAEKLVAGLTPAHPAGRCRCLVADAEPVASGPARRPAGNTREAQIGYAADQLASDGW